MDTSVLTTLACLPRQAEFTPSPATGGGQAMMRLTCPTCGKRLRLPQDFATRSGSAPCPRCLAAVAWMGTGALPAPAKPCSTQVPEPLMATLVMPNSPSQPLAPPKQCPPIQPQSLNAPSGKAQLGNSIDVPKTIRPVASGVVEPRQVSPVQSPVQPASQTATALGELPQGSDPPRRMRTLPLSWLVGLVISAGACGTICLLAGMLMVVSTRSTAQASGDNTIPAAGNQVHTAQLEIDQAKKTNKDLEEEIAVLRRESQTLQNEIEQLKKRVL